MELPQEHRKKLPVSVKIFLAIAGIGLIVASVTLVVLMSQPRQKEEVKQGQTDEKTETDGIFVSHDGGVEWSAVSGSEGIMPTVFEFKRGDTSKLYVGTEGQGLWVLDTGSQLFERVQDPDGILDSQASIYDIAQNGTGDTLYLAVFQKGRGRVIRLVETGSREIYTTSLERYGIFGLAVDFTDEKHIVLAGGDGGFFETRDGGTNKAWGVISRLREGIVRLEPSPTAPNTFWALGNERGIYSTVSGGLSWIAQPEIEINGNGISEVNDMRYHGARGSLMLATDYGLIETYNNGESWQDFQTPIPARSVPIQAIAIHPRLSEAFWMASNNQIFETEDGGITWKHFILPVSQKIKLLIVNPTDPQTIYAGLTQ